MNDQKFFDSVADSRLEVKSYQNVFWDLRCQCSHSYASVLYMTEKAALLTLHISLRMDHVT